MLQINSMPDHLHAFIGLRPDQSVSSLCQLVKSRSTKWINNNGLCKTPFRWQDGFGAFSYSRSHVERVIRYIQNQEVHHRNESFLSEYKKLLKAFQVTYDDRYIFQDLI